MEISDQQSAISGQLSAETLRDGVGIRHKLF
jgi:hypothetical protein